MAGIMKLALMASMMIVMVASLQMQSTMAQTTHVVGDTLGWNTPSDGAATYITWASQQTFNVNLSFKWETTVYHSVAVVPSQAAYDSCNAAEVTSSNGGGPGPGSTGIGTYYYASVFLKDAGAHYYICEGENHCQSGQKLAINVRGPTPPRVTPTRTAENPPMITAETSPPSPSTTARSSFTAVIPATFLAVALAFFY